MVPLVEKFKTKLRVVKCSCGHEFATSMKIPKCSECLAYIIDEK
jgi:acetone carboxylase gamma subunit